MLIGKSDDFVYHASKTITHLKLAARARGRCEGTVPPRAA